MPGPFGLADADFWSAPLRTKDAVQDRLSSEGKTGVFIDAPGRVPLSRGDLPVVGCFVVTLRDAQRVNFARSALVAAVHLDDGRLHVALVEEPRVRDPSAPARPRRDEDPGEGRAYRMFLLDAHARLPRLPWRRGALLTTVLLGGACSEPRRVKSELAPERTAAWVDPVVAEAMARKKAGGAPSDLKPWPVNPKPGKPLPAFGPDAAAPAPPAAPGLALAVPARVAPGEPLVVRGSFALPLLPQQRLAAPDPNDPAARAVVPVDLVLTGEDSPGPFHLPLGVPLHALPAEGKPAAGQFALDVLSQPAMRHRKAQRYWLWGFAGEAMSGPHEVTLD